MKKFSTICLLLGAALCLAATVWAGPGPEEGLAQEISRALTQGRELEACELALKMQRFKGTPGYDRAKTELLARGISLEAPLDSFTIKRMIDLQNKLEAERGRTGVLPDVGPRSDSPDAWGNPLRVEIITRKTFVYMIRSSGPDQRFMTDDDLAIGVREKAAPSASERSITPGMASPDPLPGGPDAATGGGGGGTGSGVGKADPAREAGRRGLYGVGSGPGARPSGGSAGGLTGAPAARPASQGAGQSAPAKPKPGAAEKEVTLDELLRK